MTENIERLENDLKSELGATNDISSLEGVRVRYLGKKGILTSLLHGLGDLDADKRRQLGATLNQIKTRLEELIARKEGELKKQKIDEALETSETIDISMPAVKLVSTGSYHPITHVVNDMITCLTGVGFAVATGPEVELEYYNFEALNTPVYHPARDLQDTFYIDSSVLLRSHTSPVQIRAMKEKPPPIQIISVGRVYRSDFDLTHTPMFHQVEGLMVDEKISFADLKGILSHLVNHLFGHRNLRFRPSYFPFTEPSAEVDMRCIQCKGNSKQCRLCKATGWLEIGGCGMVHPNVFKAVGYDPDCYTGLAFGMGVERVAMLRYGIDDLRAFFENDYRMLEQF